MKKTFLRSLSLMILAFVVLGLVACRKTTQAPTTTEAPTTETPSTTTKAPVTTTETPGSTTKQEESTTAAEEIVELSTILSSYKNNQAVCTKGVVYGIGPHGFYIQSGEGTVYVNLGSDQTPTGIAVGDEVTIKGKFSYTSNFPYIKTVTSYEKVGTGSALTSQEVEIKSTVAYDKTARTGVYGKYITVIGTIATDEAGTYYVSDDEGNKAYIDASTSNISNLEASQNKRVKISLIVYKNDGLGWTFSFTGSADSIVDATRSISDYKEIVEEHLAQVMPTEVYGTISLPSGHKTLSFLKYTWSVLSNEYVTVENNQANIIYDEEDHNVTFRCTISVGGETEYIDCPVTSKAIVKRSVKELINDSPAINMSAVKVEGIITGFIHNQSRSLYSFVMQDTEDPVNYSVCVEFNNETAPLANYKVGDKVVVEGYYRNLASGDRPCIKLAAGADGKVDTTKITIESSDNEVDLTPALVVSDEAGFNELASNFVTKYVGRIIKFVNPFCQMNKATVSTSTYIDLGHSETQKQYPFTENAVLTFGFVLMGSSDENFGSNLWYSYFGIDNTCKQVGMEVTCYAAYYESNGHCQLMVVDSKSVTATDIEKAVELDLLANIEGSQTQIVLPAKSLGYDLTWTSKTPEVVDNNGNIISVIQMNTEVTFEAKYTVEGVEKTVEIKTMALSTHLYTVSELALENASATNYRLTGTVVGFASQHGGSYNGNGILVSDGSKVLLISTIGPLTQTAKENVAGRNTYTYTVGEVSRNIAVGDEIEFTKVNVIAQGQKISLASDCELIFSEEPAGITFAPETNDLIIIDSEEDLAAYMLSIESFGTAPYAQGSENYGKIIKIVGTKENPVYIGSFNGYGLCFYYLTEEDTALSAMSYPVTAQTDKTPYLTVVPTLLGDVMGADWLSLNTPASIDYSQTYGAKYTKTTADTLRKYAMVGEMYLVFEYSGSSSYPYCYMNPIKQGSTLSVTPNKEIAETLIMSGVETEILNGHDATTWTMFTSEHPFFDSISYQSSNEEVLNLTTGACAHGDEDVTVKVTVTYTLAGSETPETLEINVVAKAAGEYTWNLLSATDSLSVGDKVIFAGKNGDKYYALSVSDYKASVEVTVSNGKLVFADTIGTLELCASTVDGFTDNVHAFAVKNSKGQYLVASKSTGQLGWQNSISANTTFIMEVSGDSYSIVAQGSNAFKYVGFDETVNELFKADAFDGFLIFKYTFTPAN